MNNYLVWVDKLHVCEKMFRSLKKNVDSLKKYCKIENAIIKWDLRAIITQKELYENKEKWMDMTASQSLLYMKVNNDRKRWKIFTSTFLYQ